MGKKVIRVTDNIMEAREVKKRINASLKSRGIKREAYICGVSREYVKTLLRKGYPVPKRNYAVCVRNKSGKLSKVM